MNGDAIGTFPLSGEEDVDARSPPRRRRSRSGAFVLAPKRGEILFRFGEFLRDQKEDLAQLIWPARWGRCSRGPRRRPGSDRHGLLHGRRGRRLLRPDDTVGAQGQVPDERPDADWGHRRDHAMELPHRDPVVEDAAGARRGQHDRLQARDGHADARPALRRADARGGLPPGVLNVVHGGAGRWARRLCVIRTSA